MRASDLEEALARHAAAPMRSFLGVDRSVTGRRWVERLDPRGMAAALDMAQRHDLPELLARVLAGRGVAAADAPEFLDPTLRRLMPDPSTLTDMDVAASRIADAIRAGEHVAIFGDYDVDGATSAALLARFLRGQGVTATIYIPDRLFEGYGPNREAIEKLAEGGARLIVTVDCGSTSPEALRRAVELGVDVVVIDHHLVGAELPPAVAVVNPNRDDDLSGLGNLAAVGLVFMTVVAVNRELRRRGHYGAAPGPDLLQWLDLVALGTVCDVVGLSGLNRAFVVKGLVAMRRQGNAGLAALARSARLGGPSAVYHLSYMLGPRINAGGRIGNAALGATLLATDDIEDAERIAMELERLNAERQAMEQVMLAEAMAAAEPVFAGGNEPVVLVTHNAGWHQGVVGLIAARLKERFHRPAFAIATTPAGLGVGSGRSVPGIDIGHAVKAAVAEGILVKGGGHAMAAGVTLEVGRLRAFEEFMNGRLATDAAEALGSERTLVVDAVTRSEGADIALFELLERAGPYGAGHPEPTLVLPNHQVAYSEVVGSGHVRVGLASGGGAALKGMAFRAAETPLGRRLLARDGVGLHIAGTLSADHWQGQARASFRIVDAADVAA
ncbi:MAG: single-stranded-DNA-specific exonuclease RecJ [Bauldia sp.]